MSNPVKVPQLQSLSGGDPLKQKDIQDLTMFLFLLRQQIGGDSAYVDLSTQIATNVTNIATNTANISTNTTNIATNTANITANTAEIEFNRRYLFALL